LPELLGYRLTFLAVNFLIIGLSGLLAYYFAKRGEWKAGGFLRSVTLTATALASLCDIVELILDPTRTAQLCGVWGSALTNTGTLVLCFGYTCSLLGWSDICRNIIHTSTDRWSRVRAFLVQTLSLPYRYLCYASFFLYAVVTILAPTLYVINVAEATHERLTLALNVLVAIMVVLQGSGFMLFSTCLYSGLHWGRTFDAIGSDPRRRKLSLQVLAMMSAFVIAFVLLVVSLVLKLSHGGPRSISGFFATRGAIDVSGAMSALLVLLVLVRTAVVEQARQDASAAVRRKFGGLGPREEV